MFIIAFEALMMDYTNVDYRIEDSYDGLYKCL